MAIRHHASVLAAALIVMGTAAPAEEPQAPELPAEQAELFDATCRRLAEAFLKNDVDAFIALCIPQELLAEVVSPTLLERGIEPLHKQLLEANAKRFTEFRTRFKDLAGFRFVSAEAGYRLEQAEAYADPELVLKNSYFTVGFANRLILKIKIEDMVLIGGNYYIITLD